jgi:hypothetical protein
MDARLYRIDVLLVLFILFHPKEYYLLPGYPGYVTAKGSRYGYVLYTCYTTG